MSYDLGVWKRSPRTKTAMLVECYNAIMEDSDHNAMDFFDEEVFLSDLEVIYGERHKEYFGDDLDKAPFLYYTGSGEYGNWVLFNINWSNYHEVQDQIIEIALKHGVMAYDPQRVAVWGNRRPLKIEK